MAKLPFKPNCIDPLKNILDVKSKHISINANKDGTFDLKISKIDKQKLSSFLENLKADDIQKEAPKSDLLPHKVFRTKLLNSLSTPKKGLKPFSCEIHSEYLTPKLLADVPCLVCSSEEILVLNKQSVEINGLKQNALHNKIIELGLPTDKSVPPNYNAMKSQVFKHLRSEIAKNLNNFETALSKMYPIHADLKAHFFGKPQSDTISFKTKHSESGHIYKLFIPLRYLVIRDETDAKAFHAFLNEENTIKEYILPELD